MQAVFVAAQQFRVHFLESRLCWPTTPTTSCCSRQLLREWVIDLDVRQGNGTASIFRDDSTVYTLSMHGARNFPFRKENSDLDVDLPDGCTDTPYLHALDEALARAWQAQPEAPRLAFYLAGADLGKLGLTNLAWRRHATRWFEGDGKIAVTPINPPPINPSPP